MLTKQEFEILKNIAVGKASDLAGLRGGANGYESCLAKLDDNELEALRAGLEERGFLKGFALKKLGKAQLEAYRVKNAVILAAGGLEMSPKLLYSTPKGLFKVNGEPIIERQIKQLQETGIDEIYVVVGYKKDMYFYLEEKLGVTLLVNQQPKKNNVFSMWAAAPVLDNTYIGSCDTYYQDNPFEPYVYRSFHATVDKEDSSQELGVVTNDDRRILALETGEGLRECLYGHAYFDRVFSEKIRTFIDEDIFKFRIDSLFWQEFVEKHIDDLDLYALKYNEGFIYELDSIQQLQLLDDMFLDSVSEEIAHKICDALECKKSDIEDLAISEKGFSNIIITFTVDGVGYVLRYPGESASLIVSRDKEVMAQHIVAKNKIDNTLVYIDEEGCKIAKFVPDCHDLSEAFYHDMDIMDRIVRKTHDLHQCPLTKEEYDFLFFDPIVEGDRLLEMARPTKGDLFVRFADLRARMLELADYMEKDGWDKVMAHVDLNISNILINDETLEFIDWEFAGVTDPTFDFGRILDGYEVDSDEVKHLLEVYLGHAPTIGDLRHFCGGVALHSWYFFCWCLYKESINEDTSFYMTYFFHRAKKWGDFALDLYENADGAKLA